MGYPAARTLAISAPSMHTTTATTASLYSRLATAGNPRVSVVPILDRWVEEGGQIDRKDLDSIVIEFRKSKRFKHCLQIVQWMSDRKIMDPSPKYVSMQLDLISKVCGVKQAEAYFDSVPNTLRVWQVYGALLSCYAKAKLLEKAEATWQKMKELGCARSLSYNVMLHLYSQLGNHEKLDLLLQEMEEKGINFDNYTYLIRLKAYGAASDIEHMEKLLMKMEADPRIIMDWSSYVSAADAYLKAGDTEMVFVTLKKSEHVIRGEEKLAYECLTTLYARMGKIDDVYRIWNLNKKSGKFYNKTCLLMINSLSKLDDLDGAKKIFEEWWEAGPKYFDLRLPNSLISAYCEKGLWGKAELIVKRLIETGNEPTATTWSHMAFGYVKDDQMDKAVEAVKKPILLNEPPRKRDLSTLASCLKYLNGKEDLDAAEIEKSLREKGLFTRNVYEKLVEHIKKENRRSNASSEMGGDGHGVEVEKNGSMELKYESREY